MEHVDAVVAGGGTAGPVVAARLVEAGRRVLLLEAGPDHGPLTGGRWPPELTDATTIPTSHDWGYESGDELPGRALAYERARVIGGCSAHNGCTVSWGHRADYDGWEARGLVGWGADALTPRFERASARMRVRRFADEDLTPFHRAFIDAGAALGYPLVDDLESLDGGPGVCAEPSNSPDGVRWNAAFAYLDPARSRIEVRGDTLVDRVLIERGRAAGVRAIGLDGPYDVHADLVVVTGGTYGSAAILLRSGVGPADELRALGVDVLADLPVGRNLHDHPAFELFHAPSEELDARTAAFVAGGHAVPDEQSFAKVVSARAEVEEGGVFDLHLFGEVSMDRRLGIFVSLVAPRSRGALTLSSLDPEAAPHLDHAYLSDPGDLEALVDGVELARRFASASPLASLLAAEVEPGPAIASRADLAAAVRAGVIHYWHPVGTCAMGSVTDADGAVVGIEGLHVADASLMPATVRATTNLPTIVIADRVADALLA